MLPRSPNKSLARLVAETRAMLVRQIEARLSRSLTYRVEAEDILQQAYVSAIPHFRRRPVDDPHGFVRWILRFAVNEIRNTSRRRSGDDLRLEWEVGLAPVARERGRLRRRGNGSGGQERVLALRDRFFLPWTSVSFILDRPNASSTRKLLGRARRRLRWTLSEVQRLAE